MIEYLYCPSTRETIIRSEVIKKGFIVHRANGGIKWTFTNKEFNSTSTYLFNSEDEVYEYIKFTYNIEIIIPGA